MTKKVLIAGYFGFRNTGDEAILSATISGLREIHPDLEFCVVSGNPEATSLNFGVRSVFWQDISSIIRYAKESDLIILGGGGLFQDYWGVKPDTLLTREHDGISFYGGFPFLAHLLNKPMMILGVGIGPLATPEGKELTRIVLQQADAITVRDAGSKEFALDLGFGNEAITLTADPAFTLCYQKGNAKKILNQAGVTKNKPLIGVCIRNWEIGVDPKQWQKSLATGLDLFYEACTCEFVFIPFHTLKEHQISDDVTVARAVRARMRQKNAAHLIGRDHPVEDIAGVVAACDLIVGARLHSIIFAASAGVPVVSLSYDPKVTQMMSQLRIGKYNLDLKEYTSTNLCSRMLEAWGNRQVLAKYLLATTELLKKAARDNYRMAMVTLDASHQVNPDISEDVISDFAIKQTLLLTKKEALISDLIQSGLDKEKAAEILRIQAAEKENEIENLKKLELEKEQNLHQLNLEMHKKGDEIQQLNVTLGIEKKTIKALQKQEVEKVEELRKQHEYMTYKDQVIREMKDQILGIEKSRGWALLQTLWKIRTWLIPHESKREQFLRKGLEILVPSKIDRNSYSGTLISSITKKLTSRKIKGIFIVTSAFEFDRFYNQRVINLTKYLSDHSWGIVYAAWRWSKQDILNNMGKEVYRNVFQLPLDMLLENPDAFSFSSHRQKYFIIEFPHPEFLSTAFRLKNHGYEIIYEIIDEWEEFSKVGQAPWFDPVSEESIVLNSDHLTAVSEPLARKFEKVRSDISIIPNGFDPQLLGIQNRGVCRKPFDRKDIHIGYFGHLTGSWFDWDFLFTVIERARRKQVELQFHLIGYGEAEVEKRVQRYPENITFHGKVQPDKLYQHARNWDLAMIPFKPGKLARAVDPIKIYEYFYFGLPVIVTGINHLKEFPNVRVIKEADEFIRAIDSLKKDQEERRLSPPEMTSCKGQDRDLQDATWDQRFERLMEKLETEKWMFS
jgi:polysaccharide pyruvyl transferase CsaB